MNLLSNIVAATLIVLTPSASTALWNSKVVPQKSPDIVFPTANSHCKELTYKKMTGKRTTLPPTSRARSKQYVFDFSVNLPQVLSFKPEEHTLVTPQGSKITILTVKPVHSTERDKTISSINQLFRSSGSADYVLRGPHAKGILWFRPQGSHRVRCSLWAITGHDVFITLRSDDVGTSESAKEKVAEYMNELAQSVEVKVK